MSDFMDGLELFMAICNMLMYAIALLGCMIIVMMVDLKRRIQAKEVS